MSAGVAVKVFIGQVHMGWGADRPLERGWRLIQHAMCSVKRQSAVLIKRIQRLAK
jgi:hypothetical protein